MMMPMVLISMASPALSSASEKTNYLLNTSSVKAMPTSVYLIQINKPIAYMPTDMYTQWASRSENNKFYVSRGPRGHVTISGKSITILAQQIIFIN